MRIDDMRSLICGLLVILALGGCSKANVGDIKKHSAETWAANGFEVVGYEGYEYTGLGRWGGCVWYVVKRGTTTYDGCISKWEDEYHVYNLKALDALKGN
jgi:hypothetical protein